MNTLQIFYLGCAIFGIVMVLASMFGADHDHDLSHDAGGADHGGDSDSSDQGPKFFSFRVMVTFLAAFGAFGFLTSYLLGLSGLLSALAGFLGGALIALFAWWLVALAFKQQASSVVTDEDLVGLEGVVITSIPTNGMGEVSLEIKGQRKYFPARTTDNSSCDDGSVIKVKQIISGHMVVEKQ